MKYFYILLSIVLLSACNQEKDPIETVINVETMGTWGTIKIITDKSIEADVIRTGIDQQLLDVNEDFSTYIPTSTISQFNDLDSGFIVVNERFISLLDKASFFFEETDSILNVKVLPLIEHYGFGSKIGTLEIDSNYVDSIVAAINFNPEQDWLLEDGSKIRKTNSVQYDFSSFAKGYGVDVVANYLEIEGYENYMVEIGGEVRAKGKNVDNELWKLGIEEPNESARILLQVISLDNMSMASSGNYRNFKELPNGQKLVHIVNPKTGYPETTDVMGATIFHESCLEADALSTACMVMGIEEAYQYIENRPNTEAILIYMDEKGLFQLKETSGATAMKVGPIRRL